jgi:hypothetical protein
LTDADGEVTLAARFTPWGDSLESYGAGNPTFGYFGGLMDAVTGLLYVDNGQYYDPGTGRFLTRAARPEQSNPYVPWDPAGALLAPLGLLAVIFNRRRKGSKWGIFLAILVFAAISGMSLSACGNDDLPAGPATATIISAPGVPLAAATATFADGTTVNGVVPTSTGTPTEILRIPCPTPDAPTQTPYPAYGNPNALMFLQAVLKHQTDLRPGFSVALLLAMGAQESGAMDVYNWSNSKPHGGVLQLREASGHYHPAQYTDTPEGYEQNVVDAIAVINFYYDHAPDTDGWLFNYIYDIYPEDKDGVTAARSVLYYNGGIGWTQVYRDYPDNIPYVGRVAGKLESYVSDFFGYRDDGLVPILKSVQHVVDCQVKPTSCQ